ncbi:MAG: response regulator [Candidatus Competibacteraceae bacterium]
MNTRPIPPQPILIVDDEAAILLSIDTVLQMAGLNNVMTCQDSRQVMNILASRPVEAMLLDLNMPHTDGRELLGQINQAFPEIPVIIVTGAVEIETAVQCMKSGAFDYVVKPVEDERLVSAVHRALAFRELKRENMALKQHILSDALERPEAFAGIVTRNKKMLAIFQYIESIAQTSQPVLIRGETGVGKELIARVLHELSGLKGHFVEVNGRSAGIWQDPRNFISLEVQAYRGFRRMYEDPAKIDFRPSAGVALPGQSRPGRSIGS